MQHQTTRLGLAALLAASAHCRPFGSSFGIPGLDATYDYVVVGGGTAGLTIASRLAEQKAGSVAVVEAGTFYEISTGNVSEVPATGITWAGKSPDDWQPLADWGYVTTPQAGANNETLHIPRGKMLGGCSARNFMIYQRPTIDSLRLWADRVGDDNYTFDNFVPFFSKSITFTPPRDELRLQNSTPIYDASGLGTGGPLALTIPNWVYAFASWAVMAFSQIGIPYSEEGFQSGRLQGHSYTMFTVDNAMMRSSSETSFLRQSLSDPNFYVYPLTQGLQVLFDDNKAATGVLVDTAGMQYVLSARKEVILSAGAIGSPQLLQVSGIGPASLLESLDIPVIVDLPGVGQNMEDHITFGITQGVNAVTTSSMGDPAFAAEQIRLYNEETAGLLTSPGSDLLAWERFPNSTRGTLSERTRAILDEYPQDWPDVEYIAFSTYLSTNFLPSVADPMDGTAYAALAVVLCKPRSKGSVNITSPNALLAPAIDPGFLTDEADIEVAIAGFKRARQFWAASRLDDFKVGDEAYPGTDVVSDADIEDSIRRSFTTIFHPASTCAMGRPEDPNAVVDSQARVYGVQGLRVVDAAAFPMLPPGHPQSTIYALAEKIACDISRNCS
ncbi:glucose-methanol-choline oxidoreductase [Stachybotrys elegans]|uniref:Glucose-methanol-choline oxidoreductase n=1 Tax=Stachybotrys elegans TaxID=80388 RepID=A0A8K0SMI5_9HYPO|nr:glucose-methanol-choline oxidoreductase [Stachybotrys elegans]